EREQFSAKVNMCEIADIPDNVDLVQISELIRLLLEQLFGDHFVVLFDLSVPLALDVECILHHLARLGIRWSITSKHEVLGCWPHQELHGWSPSDFEGILIGDDIFGSLIAKHHRRIGDLCWSVEVVFVGRTEIYQDAAHL